MTKTTPTAIWLRVSTQEQANGDSPEHHRRRAEAYAEAKGWDVVEIYDLSGVSGKSVMSHPECQRMMEDVRRGHISTLVFSKLARLARNTKELLEIADYFERHNANLVSLSESIDTSTPAGRMFFTVIAAVATFEREEISDRVKASVPIRAKMGKNTGGQASFGYQWKDGKLVPHEDEAPVRALIYELFREHGRKKQVARILNERGYRTRRGAKFSDTTVDRLLRDPNAKGLRLANYTESAGPGSPATLKDKSEWIYVDCPAVVDVALWDECNQMLSAQAQSRTPRSRPAKHLFGGKTICHCGEVMYFRKQLQKYDCPSCHNKVRGDDLEAIFIEQIQSFLLSEDEIENYLLDANERSKAREQELQSALREQTKVKAQIDKLFDLHLAGDLDKAIFLRRHKPLEEQLSQLEESIPALQAAFDVERIALASSDQMLEDARSVYSRWHDISNRDKQKIVEAICHSITIGTDEIDISLHYLSHPPTLSKSDEKATNGHGFMAATS